jgi:hypothetical protein
MSDCRIRFVGARRLGAFAVGTLVVGTLVVGLAVAQPFKAGAEPRAVVELFTSQGCSSCPAADHLLGELNNDPTVLAVSLPIDYWDYLGWKDTLADARHSARQKAYSEMRGDRSVYTPQIVVNGVVQALGSDKIAIERAVEQSRRNAAVLSVPVMLSVDKDAVTVKTSGGEVDTPTAEVWLCPVARTVQVRIGRGEKRGKTVTYTNVVRGWIKLGSWTGKEATWSVPIGELESGGADALAVFVQSGTPDKPGAMIGAALTALH